MTKVLFLTIGDKTVASSRARVYGYKPFLAQKKIKYKILSFTSSPKCRRILNLKRDNIFQSLFELFYKIYILGKLFVLSFFYDVIFIQKVVVPLPVWKMLGFINKKIIYDFDDAIYLGKNMSYLLDNASCVVVSNKNLMEFASRHAKNVRELISPVKVGERTSSKKGDTVILGWVGSPETSKYLNIILAPLKELMKSFKNLKVVFMGAHESRRFESLGIETLSWSLEAEEKFLEEIDIGIMPLENDEWSRSKAGYKLLLYMSRGIPCVASPVGINREIIEEGVNGYFASTPEEWYNKLSLLISDRLLRESMVTEGQKLTGERYSYKVNAPRLVQILTQTQ